MLHAGGPNLSRTPRVLFYFTLRHPDAFTLSDVRVHEFERAFDDAEEKQLEAEIKKRKDLEAKLKQVGIPTP